MFPNDRRFNIIASIINISIIVILLCDTFIFPFSQGDHTVSDFEVIHVGRGRGIYGYANYFVNTESGDRYEVSQSCQDSLKVGDIITITRSGLFRKTLKISYDNNFISYSENIGKWNSSKIVLNTTIFSIIVSLSALLFSVKTYNNMLYHLLTALHFIALLCNACNFLIYFL
jgi:hypothetical protein